MKREDTYGFRTTDLVRLEDKTRELESKIMFADWYDVVSLQDELESYRKRMENGEFYDPKF